MNTLYEDGASRRQVLTSMMLKISTFRRKRTASDLNHHFERSDRQSNRQANEWVVSVFHAWCGAQGVAGKITELGTDKLADLLHRFVMESASPRQDSVSNAYASSASRWGFSVISEKTANRICLYGGTKTQHLPVPVVRLTHA